MKPPAENKIEFDSREPEICFIIGNDLPEEIIKISKEGFYYKGEKVEDVHNVYERFNKWLGMAEAEKGVELEGGDISIESGKSVKVYVDSVTYEKSAENNSWEKEFFDRFGANKIWVTPSRDNVETVLEIHSFICTTIEKSLEEQRGRIKADLLAIADVGEYEDLRREVENYFYK